MTTERRYPNRYQNRYQPLPDTPSGRPLPRYPPPTGVTVSEGVTRNRYPEALRQAHRNATKEDA